MGKPVRSQVLLWGLGLSLAAGLSGMAGGSRGQVDDLVSGQKPLVKLPDTSVQDDLVVPPLRLVQAATYPQVLQQLTLPDDREPLLQAIGYSLDYLATPKAGDDYEEYSVAGVTRNRVWQSLQRLRQLIQTSPSDEAFRRALADEFLLYQSIGNDGKGTVAFTGYFEPYYQASATPTEEFRYPLYQRPQDLDDWPLPHPTREALEGRTGLESNQGPLAGLELVWLASRLEAFLVQVQGSAKLQLTNGQVMSVGYAGRTDYPYTSIGQALVADGKIPAEDLSLPNLIAYFDANPDALDDYITKNQRFIFFRETAGGAPTGSLSVPVTAGMSIATDKALMPPGAMALIQVSLPQPTATGEWINQPTTRLVLDQDTGGAIIGPGRVDLFVGSGPEAGELAGRINTTGGLYYLLLRPMP
jgi:membrane-bound lytic murein transglycosylase A